MLNEKPSNDFHWKSKLEDLESLPGVAFNKGAAWEKVHERMQGKSGNKKAVWYWAAAACLLLALLIPWFLANEKESVLVKTDSGQKHIQSSSARRLQPGHKDTSSVISSLTVEKKLPAISVEKSNGINSFVDHKTMHFKNVQDKKEKEAFTRQKIANNAVMPIDAEIRIVATLPEKKKLKVVHINELGDPIEETPNIARYSEHHSFKLKLMNQEVYTNPLPSGSTGFNIFKPKNAPSN